jgi:hypothetical protein
MTSRRWPLLLALILLLPGALRAQLQTGDLYGTVVDESGKPLPGATVTLSGIGAPQTRSTDANGGFRFVGLYPGQYQLEAQLAGFSDVEQTGIGIRIGAKVVLSVTMSSAVTETINIVSEAPLINPREQNQGPMLSQQELDQIPTARDPWSLLRQAPGVLTDRINVGGNESGQQSNFYVGGATGADNVFSVDGVNLTDMAAVGGSATYFDFGAYEEVQLTTSSTDVSIQTAGVTVNQVTKRGSNEWKGDGRYLRTEGDWQAATKEVDGNKIDSVEEYGANLGGPIQKDHLWIWASYGESDIGNLAAGTGQLDRTKLHDTNSKLNFSWGQNSGVLHYWTNDKVKNGRNAGPEFSPESTWDQTTPSDIWKVEDTQLFGSKFYLGGFYSRDDGAFTLSPEGGLDADVLLDEDGVWQGSFWDFDQTALITQVKADGNYFLDTSSWQHELKFGAGYREQENDSISVLPGSGKAVLTCEGYGCDPGADNIELVEWSRHNIAVTTKYTSAWFQDTLTHDHWTITAGLRYDKQTAQNDPILDPGQSDVPGGLFPRIDFKGNNADNLDWNSIVPRVGVTYAAGDQGKTLLRGTFSRYAAQLGQWVANQVSPTAPYSYVYYYFTDANRNLKFDPSEAGSLSYYYVYNVNLLDPTDSPNRNDSNLKPYMTDEVTLSLQHAFPGNFGVSATLIYRDTTDLLDQRTLIDDGTTIRPATRDDYVQDGTEDSVLPDGKLVSLPTYSLRDGLSPTGGTLLTNGDREIEYWGLILGFQKPMANRWSLRGNFTWNDNKLKVGPEFRHFDDPTDNIFAAGGGGDGSDIYLENGYGNKRLSAINSRWSFNLNGVYQVAPERPWGFNVAASITGREGSPLIPSSSRSFFGRQVSGKLDDFRLSDVYTIDARIEKDFQIKDLRLTASIDGFNLANSQPVLQRRVVAPSDPADLPDSYGVLERLSPRVFRWGVMFHFR